ncbi:MAG: hypothetical protein RLZZ338_123 [Cyanobacteriota bacterium]|jgi:hypothetical protein
MVLETRFLPTVLRNKPRIYLTIPTIKRRKSVVCRGGAPVPARKKAKVLILEKWFIRGSFTTAKN